jgi:hypothetical protein
MRAAVEALLAESAELAGAVTVVVEEKLEG